MSLLILDKATQGFGSYLDSEVSLPVALLTKSIEYATVARIENAIVARITSFLFEQMLESDPPAEFKISYKRSELFKNIYSVLPTFFVPSSISKKF